MRSISSIPLATIALVLALTVLAISPLAHSANSASVIRERQTTRQHVVARASRTRPKRQATSPLPCPYVPGGVTVFRIEYSRPDAPRSFLKAVDYFYRRDTETAANRFTLDLGGRLLHADTNDFAAYAGSQGQSVVIARSGIFTNPLVCAISSSLRLTCRIQDAARDFYTCPSIQNGALTVAPSLPDTSCTFQVLTVVPECPA